MVTYMLVVLLATLQALTSPQQKIERELLAVWGEQLDAEEASARRALADRRAAESAFYDCARAHAQREELDACDGDYATLRRAAIAAEVKIMRGKADPVRVDRYLSQAAVQAGRIAETAR